MRPAGIPGREDRARQPGHEVHLPLVGDGLQSRDFVHPLRGRRLGLPRRADAPLVRPASRGPTAPKAEPSGASQRPPCGPRRQCHTDLLSSRTPLGRRHLPVRKACWERKGLGAKVSFLNGSHSNQSKLGNPSLAPPHRQLSFSHRWDSGEGRGHLKDPQVRGSEGV